ncbi:hypothetical protein [Niastella caeni]|uniref:hypothetical protein n=1 Tax=Niastella caeni TaxID=2569763 RepID=UPI00129ABF50|nr:hypothetical protein [Niastella caeni]
MKLLTKPVILISGLLLIKFAAGCKKDDGNAIVIKGFEMKDASGNDFGHYGPADND